MISTGFQELDRVIGGLKKGRLYGLATLNFDRIGAEYFALDMIDNIRRSAFFHPTVDCSYLMAYAEAHYQFKPLFFNQNPNENAEEVCEKFESLYRDTPFELAIFDIDKMTARDWKQFSCRPHEIKHIIVLFQALAEKYHIPVVLINRCHDLRSAPSSHFPGKQLDPCGYPRALIETAEKILVLSRTPQYIWKISIYDHFSLKETLLIDKSEKTPSGNPA